jgi:hypothetical protein
MYLFPWRWAVFDFDCHHGVLDADAMVMVLDVGGVWLCEERLVGCEL